MGVNATAAGGSSATTLSIGAPIAGWVIPLDDVPDPVFAGRVLGDGVAIDPFELTLRAPCDGVVTTLHRAHHAITLHAEAGFDILMHIGLDTVALKGEGFTAHVAEGQAVKAGEALISFDMAALAQRAPSLLVPVIVVNGEDIAILGRSTGCEVRAGAELMVPARRGGGAAAPAEADGGAEVRRDVVVAAADGLHARPAGLVAQCARGFAARVTLQAGGRSASARSAVTIMGLGVQRGDTVTVLARGADAEQAAQQVADLLVSAMGDVPAAGGPRAPAPAPAPARAEAFVELPPFAPGREVVLTGVAAAPGAAVGQAVRVRQQSFALDEVGAGAGAETERLGAALSAAEAGLRTTLDAAPDKGSAAHAILTAHLAFLEDPDLREAAQIGIDACKSAAFAWHQAIAAQVAVLHGLGDARMAERANDLLDVEKRVLAAMAGEHAGAPPVLPQGAVLVAEELLPSQLAGLEAGHIAGICTAGGGPTSHVAILAGALGIPAVVAVGAEVLRVPDGAPVILDAGTATLRVFPPEEEAGRTRAAIAARRARATEDLRQAQEECHTADGVRIEVFANLGGFGEVAAAVANGAEGCGLLRSEFLFLNRSAAPDEAEQLAHDQAIATGLGGRPLIVRTIDAGADKGLPYLGMPPEDNPQLGVRGIWLSLARPDLLRAQLRAILQVQPAGQCRIMLPMVANLDELRQARVLLEEVRVGLGHSAPVSLGIMIEVPSAALMAEALAAEADFFSIGTNDLTQYVLAMDRLNPALAKQVDAFHPAVLHLIARTVEGARRHGRWVGVCGGMASVPLAAPVLVGLGVTELSATAAAVPRVKAVVRELTMPACQAAAREALAQASAGAVRALLARAWPNA